MQDEVLLPPPVDHSPKNGRQLDKSPTDYHPVVQQLIYRIGPFLYKEYLKCESRWYNPTEEDLELPYLAPFMLPGDIIYIGQWKLGKRHCRGKAIFPDKSVYEGFWNEDEQSGWGRLIFTNGDYYEGEFQKNRANGRGKQVTAKGFVFEGEWVDDKQEGEGKETWPDGTTFQGTY